LNSIERYKDRFEITTKLSNSLCQITFKELARRDSERPPLHIIVSIRADNEAYSINCFEIMNNQNNREERARLYSIKVEGPWQLETLKNDLQKIVKREFKTFRRQYYPL
jgi:nucleotidyltransferase/DNA polymerase involved in DNA repair